MEENNRDKTENKMIATEDVRWRINRKSKLWVPKHKKRTGFEGKTLWDWLDLVAKLAIPIVVVGATITFGILQAYFAQQQHVADQQRALDQQQATILQTYMDNMQDLLFKYNLLGESPKPNNSSDLATIQEVRELARARTLTALQGLDPERKGHLVQFLYEAQLIGFLDNQGNLHNPVILLNTADLIDANLQGADLIGADFTGANLINANLSESLLIHANFSYTALYKANLYNAFLYGAHLNEAHLNEANLVRAHFSGGANLSSSIYFGIPIRYKNLTDADLTDADLTNVNLQEAQITQNQLDQAVSCKNANFPPGLTCHHN